MKMYSFYNVIKKYSIFYISNNLSVNKLYKRTYSQTKFNPKKVEISQRNSLKNNLIINSKKYNKWRYA